MEILNGQSDPVPQFARPHLSDYCPPLRIKTKTGVAAWLRQPPPDWTAHVASLCISGFPPWQADPPRHNDHRIGEDNIAWIIGCWLPGQWRHPRYGDVDNVAARIVELRPASKPNTDRVRNGVELVQMLVESYGALVELPDNELRSYEEACCNGSSGVPDEQMPCGAWAYDPAASMHDYSFDLHHIGASDAFGRVWNFPQSNNGYADIYQADGFSLIAARRRLGLPIVARGVWNSGASRTGLAAAH